MRRVLWRPDYPCELALVSNAEFGGGSGAELIGSPRIHNTSLSIISATALGAENKDKTKRASATGETVEIWDVRRGWIAKWAVEASPEEGWVTGAP